MVVSAGLHVLLPAATDALRDGLQLLAAQQQQQQQQERLVAESNSSSPTSSGSSSSSLQWMLNTTACLCHALLELFNMWVSAAAITPAAAASAAGRMNDDMINFGVLLTNPAMEASAEPMARLALALLRTPLDKCSSSSSSEAVSASNHGPVRRRKPELDAIAVAAQQVAKAVSYIESAQDHPLPAAVLQLLLVNLAYAVQREHGCAAAKRRHVQLLLALGVSPEDAAVVQPIGERESEDPM
jgi:hypothetical protein